MQDVKCFVISVERQRTSYEYMSHSYIYIYIHTYSKHMTFDIYIYIYIYIHIIYIIRVDLNTLQYIYGYVHRGESCSLDMFHPGRGHCGGGLCRCPERPDEDHAEATCPRRKWRFPEMGVPLNHPF